MGSFSAAHWFILAAIVVFVYWLLVGSKTGAKTSYCKSCGTVAKSTPGIKGSILIEVVLWCCFIVPGIVYSLWRATTRYQKCPACGSGELVPPDSPLAKAEIAKQRAE